jgi:hypothetical protein
MIPSYAGSGLRWQRSAFVGVRPGGQWLFQCVGGRRTMRISRIGDVAAGLLELTFQPPSSQVRLMQVTAFSGSGNPTPPATGVSSAPRRCPTPIFPPKFPSLHFRAKSLSLPLLVAS